MFWIFNGLAQIFYCEFNKGKKNEWRAKKINKASEYTQDIKIRTEKRKQTNETEIKRKREGRSEKKKRKYPSRSHTA